MKLGRNELGVETTAGTLIAVGEPGVTWLLMERSDGSRFMAAANSVLIEEARLILHDQNLPKPTPYELRLARCPEYKSGGHRFHGEPSGRGMGFDDQCRCGAVSNRYPFV